jgi:hypothetical protein
LATAAVAEEWPGWRGPRGDGTSSDTHLPTKWSATENVAWKTPLPGTGHSSPAIWGDRIFLTSCREAEQERLLLCLDRKTGAVLWERVVVKSPLEKKHKLNSFASSTPATDGRHVWVSFFDRPRMRVYCYDLDGHLVWQQSPGEFHSVHGFCSSPVLYKDLVIVNGDQDAEAFLVALEKGTGKERWRANRPNRTRSYVVPIIANLAGRQQLVLSGSKCVTSYNPDTGELLWIIDGPTEQFVASLVHLNGMLFLTAGFPEYHVLAIRPDGSGNVTKTHIAWRDTKGAGYVPSPVAYDRWFFLVNDGGVATCFEAATGKREWTKRLGHHHSASPVVANGLLYFPDDDGVTYVLKAGPALEVVSRNELGEECYASPAVAQGQLFLRTVKHLWCIGQ